MLPQYAEGNLNEVAKRINQTLTYCTLWKGCEILKIIKKSQVINFKGIFVMVKFSDSNLLILKTVTVSYNKMKHSMTKKGPSTSRTIVKGSD